MLSDRPHAMANYQLQGTNGAYESARARGEFNRIWLRSKNKEANQWMNLEELSAKYLPPQWKKGMLLAQKAGHGGGDFFEVLDFADAVLGIRPPPIGIDQAMDMTLPGLISQLSIQKNGAWLKVPDSRQW
jgi:hypothetical protein